MTLWIYYLLCFLWGIQAVLIVMAVFFLVQAERIHRRNVKKWGKEYTDTD